MPSKGFAHRKNNTAIIGQNSKSRNKVKDSIRSSFPLNINIVKIQNTDQYFIAHLWLTLYR
ncbi:hypothetical protein D3C83_158990 [compost metagenome]